MASSIDAVIKGAFNVFLVCLLIENNKKQKQKHFLLKINKRMN